MRIQHNIMAMNAYRNYSNNVSAMQKNLEKLSSGYKINRAGDDAAGLAISEKMRAQISGLEAAQKNAKDGISLVQTAEGALTEVHDMLNRMVTLATQSANGTYSDTTDREQLQKEVNQLLDEINRIADSSNFNGIKLLDGSMASGADAASYTKMGSDDILKLMNTDFTGTTEADVAGGKGIVETEGTAKSSAGFQISLDNVNVTGKGEDFTLKIGSQTLKATLASGTAYDGKALATELAKAGTFTDDAGNDYTVTNDGNVLKFTSTGTNKINNESKVSWTNGDPADTSVKYSLTLTDADISAIEDAGKITIDGNEITLTDGIGDIDGETGTDNNYEIAYDATTKTITLTDATGSAAAPAINYGAVDGTEVTGAAGDTAADAEAATLEVTGFAAGESITIDGTTIAYNTLDSNGDKTDVATANGNATYSWDDTGKKLTITAKTAGEAGNDIYLTGTVGGDTVVAPGTLAGGDETTAATKSLTLTAGDEVKIGNTTLTYTALDAAGDKTDEEVTADGFKYSYTKATGALTITALDVGADGNKIEYTGIVNGETVGMKLENGADAVKATATFDFSGVTDLEDGDTVTIDGKDFTWNTDLATTIGTGTAAETTNYTLSVNEAGDTLTLTAKAADAGDDVDLSGDPLVTYGGSAGTNLTATQPTSADSGTINAGLQNVTDYNSGASAQLANAVVDLSGAMKDGAQITLGDTTYTVALGADSKYKDASNVVYLSDAEKTDAKAFAMRLTAAAKDNKTFSVGHDGTGKTTLQQLSSAKDSTDMTTKEKIASYIGVSTVSNADVANSAKGLTLQIGDTAESFNQLQVSIKDMHAASLGLDGIDISTQEGAQAAIDKIKDAINKVSDVRGTLGATQNRLDHTINNLSVMTENIQDAESTIRDVDVAEEMMAYTKNSILIQSAQAMLAQANQVPQGVLQLLG